MQGILQTLKDNGFRCFAQNWAEDLIIDDFEEPSRLVWRPFETPKPQYEQIEVENGRPVKTRPLFRYFLDGSMRTTGAGHIVDTKNRYLPIFIVQIGVAATKLDGKNIVVETYQNKNILFFPGTFSDEDTKRAREGVKSAARTARLPLDIELECYPLEDKEKPIDCARKQALSAMHMMEIDLIAHLAESGKVTRDALLMIDGSLQFYKGLESRQEAFHNVVGVAKSFDLHQRVGSGRKSKEVGMLVAGLKHRHRTAARKIAHRNLTIGAWYLRLHSYKSFGALGITDGVVKIEVFPDGATGANPVLDANRCNLISQHVLALHHPTTPWTDSRWASHLYPIHVTERYIKSRFRGERIIRACL